MSSKNKLMMGFYEARSGIFYQFDSKEEFLQLFKDLHTLNEKKDKIHH